MLLSKAISELLGTLADPIWRRILALSWVGRFIVLLVMLGLTLVSTHMKQTVSSIGRAEALSRVAWSSDSRIPLPQELVAQVRDTVKQIAASLNFDQLGSEPATYAWSIAQATVASHRLKPIDTERIAKFFRDEADSSCSCWKEIPEETHPRNIPASGWVMFALAEIGAPATSAEINFFVDEQQRGGWWSVFPVEKDDLKYASTYGTAWALLALHNQRSKKLISGGDDSAARAAIAKGAGWLINRREPKARWKDYPQSTSGKISESLSGLVVHVLHTVWPYNLRKIDQAWLDSLPARAPAVGDADRGYCWINGKDGSHLESIVQIKLPWMLIATVDAYPSGSIWQRAKALQWIESALQQESVTADTQERNWWRAELLYALKYVLQSTTALPKDQARSSLLEVVL